MVQNKAFMYKQLPDGWPELGKDLAIESTEFNLEAEPPASGLITKNLYASIDPSQRSTMRAPHLMRAFKIGSPLPSSAVIAKVLKSAAKQFQVDDIILLIKSPMEEYSLINEEQLKSAKVLHPAQGISLTTYIGALGLTGLSAYGSLHEIGQMKKGETLLLSAAAGAVGQIAGQIALRKGLKVIGSVGSDQKVDVITKELGFTSGFNYKTENIGEALDRLAPDGIDIYFDNVGGEMLDEALIRMNDFGRIIACGTVSQYNKKEEEKYGIKNYQWMSRKRLRYQGFLVFDENIMKYEKQRNEDITAWILDGSFKTIEHIVEGGMDTAFDGFVGMLKGENLGRTILKIAEP